MQVDFLKIYHVDGSQQIYDLATEQIIDVSCGCFFNFEFETEVVSHLRQEYAGGDCVDYFFIKKV